MEQILHSGSLMILNICTLNKHTRRLQFQAENLAFPTLISSATQKKMHIGKYTGWFLLFWLLALAPFEDSGISTSLFLHQNSTKWRVKMGLWLFACLLVLEFSSICTFTLDLSIKCFVSWVKIIGFLVYVTLCGCLSPKFSAL